MSATGAVDRSRNRAVFARIFAERKRELQGLSKAEMRAQMRALSAENEKAKKTALLPRLLEGIDDVETLATIEPRMRAFLCPSQVRPLLRRFGRA